MFFGKIQIMKDVCKKAQEQTIFEILRLHHIKFTIPTAWELNCIANTMKLEN